MDASLRLPNAMMATSLLAAGFCAALLAVALFSARYHAHRAAAIFEADCPACVARPG